MDLTGRVGARATWMGGVAATLLLVWACGATGTTATNVPTGQVRGNILEVVEREDDQLAGLRLSDSSGMVWAFTTEGNVAFTASHTRLHQVLGQTLLVSYVTREGRLLILDITD